VVIISVRQECEFIEGRQDYRIKTGVTYRERRVPMEIREFKDN